MLLENKTAIVYGGAGSIGAAVARAFAREGASVYLAARTLTPLQRIAEEIVAVGGAANAAQVDALDGDSVERHASGVVDDAGGIDISFNATSNGDVQGTELVDLPFEDFARPVITAATTKFFIATAVARHMTARGSGVILAMGGGREAFPTSGEARSRGRRSPPWAASWPVNSDRTASAWRGCSRVALPRAVVRTSRPPARCSSGARHWRMSPTPRSSWPRIGLAPSPPPRSTLPAARPSNDGPGYDTCRGNPVSGRRERKVATSDQPASRGAAP